MPFKVKHNKEIHIFKGPEDFQSLTSFVENSFKSVPEDYILYYIDCDGDQITLSCDEDLKALKETCDSKNIKVFIGEELKLSSRSSEEFEEILKKESESSETELIPELIPEKIENIQT